MGSALVTETVFGVAEEAIAMLATILLIDYVTHLLIMSSALTLKLASSGQNSDSRQLTILRYVS